MKKTIVSLAIFLGTSLAIAGPFGPGKATQKTHENSFKGGDQHKINIPKAKPRVFCTISDKVKSASGIVSSLGDRKGTSISKVEENLYNVVEKFGRGNSVQFIKMTINSKTLKISTRDAESCSLTRYTTISGLKVALTQALKN